MPTKLQSAALTDPGLLREINEDTVYHRVSSESNEDAAGLFIVADGVGGRLAGEAASYWAIESIKNSFSDLIHHHDPRSTHRFSREEINQILAATAGNPDDLERRVFDAVEKANSVVRDYADHKPDEARGAGSTITMALVHGLEAFIANVGDSRTYVLRDGKLIQITKDHSLIQRLIDEGTVPEAGRYTHPQRNYIYRSLGFDDSVKIDIFTLTLASGDALLLCTDGLWEMVQSPEEIARIIHEAPSMESACQRLIDAANAAGGADNIGVVLVGVYE